MIAGPSRVHVLAVLLFGFFALSFGRSAPLAADEGDLDLRSQTSYVAADGVFDMVLEWNGPLTEDITLTVIVHGRVDTEINVSEPPGQILNSTTPVPLVDLPRNESNQILAQVPIRSSSPQEPGRLLIPDPGVYPVTVEVRGADGPLSSIRTNLIRLPTETAEVGLLPVAVVLTISSADGLTVDEASFLLETHPSIPVAVLLDPGVVPQLSGDPDAAARFIAAVGGRPVLALPQLDLDPSALAGIGQGDLYQTAMDETREQLRRLGLTPATSLVPIETQLTADGARLLLNMGVDSVVDISGRSGQAGFITVDDRTLNVLRLDEELTRGLAGTRFGVERAHRLLARMAVRNETDRSPVVLGGESLSKAGIGALDVIMSALDELGLLQAAELASSVSTGLPIRPQESPSQDLVSVRSDIAEAISLIETYDTFHESGGATPQRLQTDLLAALSRDLNPTNRTRAVQQVATTAQNALEVITLLDSQSVTLAAQTSSIPLTIENRATGPRTILLRFQSDKVDVEQDNETVTIQPGTSSINIDIEARSVGLSPLEVVVLTPDGQQELARTRFRIRSTALRGSGMLISGIAMLLLLLWWARSIRTKRQPPPDRNETSAHDQATTDNSLDVDARDRVTREGVTAVDRRASHESIASPGTGT